MEAGLARLRAFSASPGTFRRLAYLTLALLFAIVVSGAGGNDTLDSGPDDDFQIVGDSSARDLASGDGGHDVITGGSGDDGFLIGDNGVFTCEGSITGDGGNDVISAGAGNDAPIVGDSDPVCGVPTGNAGDDSLFGDAGDDQLHGDNFTDTGNPVFDSGTGNDTCDGAAGTDTAVNCERLAGVP